MGAPKKKVKAKRNIFTLSIAAQSLLDAVPATQKSKTVSEAIIKFLSDMNPFIIQTAKDYSLTYDVVNEVYLKHGIEKMYGVLESIIIQKSKS